MANDFYTGVYNPDVLSCIANLSNDEVFTPPDVANRMLDMLPQDLFTDPNTKFLDPATKSGVFLREIAKRLIVGLEPVYPDLQERIDHIFHEQLYGIAITELTSLLSRRSVYCSKYPNSIYSVSKFDSAQGNIRFKRMRHRWQDGKCMFCGASQKEYERDEVLESHAYELIHTTRPEEIFKMKFDVICGNPPYQLNTSDASKQAKPIYHLFVRQAKKLNPRYPTMIIPSRWFAGGMGLDSFRQEMMSDRNVRSITDFANAKDCFPQNSISGGVCYFLWDRDNAGPCRFINIIDGKEYSMERSLNEFPVLVRYNEAVSIVRKIAEKQEPSVADIVSPISPFGIPTKVRGSNIKSKIYSVPLHTSAGVSYIKPEEIIKGKDYLNSYKVLLSQTGAEHAGEPSKDGKFRVLTSTMKVLEPGEVCTHSYLVLGPLENAAIAESILDYIKTFFVRFLVLLAMTSIHLTKTTFLFVPMQDFSEKWTDEKLYAKYGLSDEEIAFIESMIKPMD